MKERPILFSADMIRAILDRRKTQTRRVIVPQPAAGGAWGCIGGQGFGFIFDGKVLCCPYGQPGDRLWIRTAYHVEYDAKREQAVWRAPGLFVTTHGHPRRKDGRPMRLGNKPATHMPYWLSAEAYGPLEVTDVRVQRLMEITPEDAIAEGLVQTTRFGAPAFGCRDWVMDDYVNRPVPAFYALWDSINANRGYDFDTNPWVWAVTFRPLPGDSAPLREKET